MAWSTPRTWNANEVVTASHMNAQIRDNLTILKVAVNDSGLINAITTAYFASVDGTAITGVAKLASANTFTGTNTFTTDARLVIPVGTDLWA